MPALPQQVNAFAFAGSEWIQGYTLTNDDGTPVDLTEATFELVIRPAVTDATIPALVSITATETAQGYLTVTGNVVLVILYPAATTVLAQGSRPYALWMNPGTTSATALVTGSFNSALIAAA